MVSLYYINLLNRKGFIMVHPLNECNDFSDVTSAINALKDALFHIPHTDGTKIEFIKEELSNGRYQIKSCSLATKLMEQIHLCREEMEEII